MRKPLHLSLFIIFGLFGCYTVPETGRSALTIIPENSLAQQSKLAFSQMKSQKRISHNRQYNNTVQRVGRRIATAAGHQVQSADWEFIVFDDASQINAFAMPGGKIGVYTGLLNLVSSDDELAFVMSHEVSHVAARHSNEQMSQKIMLLGGGFLLGKAIEDHKLKNMILAAYGGLGTLGTLRYGRSHESEADKIGQRIMARAGYDPRASVTFWQKMMSSSTRRQTPEFLSTHPADHNRINALRANLPFAITEFDLYNSTR